MEYFKDFGCTVRVTSYGGDDGIDVIALDRETDETVAIQVKRYRGKIEVEQIRSFAGALMLGGITKGIFVTTSQFQSGAAKAVQKYQEKGLGIRLWDAGIFYDRLRLAQRREYTHIDDPTAPFYKYWENVETLPVVNSASW